ncbi:hypothetical protein BGZ81_009411 [Podila clonocystis]|nr:hypothetical protein BGZ81_009411 [Podila clonocystis]
MALLSLTLRYQPSLGQPSQNHNDRIKQESPHEQYQRQRQEQQLRELHQHQQQEQQERMRQKQQEQQSQPEQHPVPSGSFKVPESLHLTHDVAIPHDIPAWTQQDTESLKTVIGATFMAEALRFDYGKHQDLKDHPERLNFAEFSRVERIYKSLWNHVLPIFEALPGRDREKEKALLKLAETRPEIDFFIRLEKRLFPWLHYGRYTSFSLYRTYRGRGIVFCAGNGQFEFVVTAIQAVRNRLKSTLPIQVYHMGESDLSRERQTYLRDMADNIEVLDVTHVLDNEYMKLGGWAIKPYAMLASSFEEVMFVDADAYFLQDPAVLYEDEGYKATGALFFFDRTLFQDSHDIPEFMKTIMPVMSSFPPLSRTFNRLSAHEQESGVVLINKKTRFLGMLATCKMNGKWERDLVSYRIFHGDKETFWIGFEMIQDPYAFMRNYGGVIGELREDNKNSVCGAQLHQDSKGKPLWWNGGLYRNKNKGVTRNLNFGYWMSGGGHQKHRERFTRNSETMIQVLMDLGLTSSNELDVEERDADWDFDESCLEGAEVNALSQADRELANGYVDIDSIARADGESFRQGKIIDPKSHDWTNARS